MNRDPYGEPAQSSVRALSPEYVRRALVRTTEGELAPPCVTCGHPWGKHDPFGRCWAEVPGRAANITNRCACGAYAAPGGDVICRCNFDLTVRPVTVDGSRCDYPDHRADAAAVWNAAPNWDRYGLLVNAPGGAA